MDKRHQECMDGGSNSNTWDCILFLFYPIALFQRTQLFLFTSGSFVVVTHSSYLSLQIYVDDEVGSSRNQCYQFEVTVIEYKVTFTARIPTNCNVLNPQTDSKNDNPGTEKVISYTLSKKGLISPYSLILRNSKSEGYAILEQIDVQVTRHQLKV